MYAVVSYFGVSLIGERDEIRTNRKISFDHYGILASKSHELNSSFHLGEAAERIILNTLSFVLGARCS